MNKSIIFSSKVFALSVLLSGFAYAAEAVNTDAVASSNVSTNSVVAPAAKCDACSSHDHSASNSPVSKTFGSAVKQNWNDFTAALSAKKAAVTAYASGVKARGWTGLNRNEKIAFVAAGAAVAAVVAYGAYKLYQSCTKTDKKSSVRKNRN